MSLVICLHYQTSPHSIKMILYFRNRLSGTANRKQQQSRQTESCVLSQQIFDGFTPNLLPVLGTLFWGCRKFLLGHLTCLATPLLLAAIFLFNMQSSDSIVNVCVNKLDSQALFELCVYLIFLFYCNLFYLLCCCILSNIFVSRWELKHVKCNWNRISAPCRHSKCSP